MMKINSNKLGFKKTLLYILISVVADQADGRLVR